MSTSTIEPPGLARRSNNVITLRKIPKSRKQTPAQRYASIEAMVATMRPTSPVYCLRPEVIAATAKWFLAQFPGQVLYAVKTNPDMQVLATLARAGITHYDVASLDEIKRVSEVMPDAHLHFMHPVKSRDAIASAYFNYGVRDFSLDCHEELQKILDVTGYAADLNLYVRIIIPNDQAAYALCGKFGVALESAASLLAATRKTSRKLGLCFHVGSQCMDPHAYGRAMQLVADLLSQTDVRLDVLDIGGGFPSIYPTMTPPPLTEYMAAIKESLASFPQLAACELFCEPGRALVAEGGSTVARVELRKGNALYLNEGTYGSLFDAGVPGFVFPVKAVRPEGVLSDELAEFSFYGPTCDSMDTMKGPFHLPKDIAEGDWIEIGQLGAYGATMATRFNGFFAEATVEVADRPLLSLMDVN